MEQVGWGRITRADLDQLIEMNTRYHDFMLRTPYSTQVVASNLANHIRATVDASASGKLTPGELGTPTDHFILLDAHDGNLSWLGGLLRLDWLLQDQIFNATPPGSGLVLRFTEAAAPAGTVSKSSTSARLSIRCATCNPSLRKTHLRSPPSLYQDAAVQPQPMRALSMSLEM